MSIKLNSTLTLLKYINCLERVLFIDNKWMKYYEDLEHFTNKEYKGVALYLKKLLDAFNQNNIGLFSKLPSKDNIRIFDGRLECIVLESINPSRFMPNDEVGKNLIVVACPSIERILYFKAQTNENLFLHKATLNRFFYHPQLSRIKIQSKNFSPTSEIVNLKTLKFLYTLPSDANEINNSVVESNGNFYQANLVPDPSVGVSIGNLSNYFVMPLKVIDIIQDHENIRQVILKCIDWRGAMFSFHITVKLFRETLKSYPDEFPTPIFVRCLVFQEFCEEFRSILLLEKIEENDFNKDSFLAFVNFRRKVLKDEIKIMPEDIPEKVAEKENYYIYKPDDFDDDDSYSISNFSKHKIVYPKILRYFRFHPELKQPDKKLVPVIISRHNITGLHKDIIKSSDLDRLKFYCLNKNVIIFCTNCKSYKTEIRVKDCPNECPNCGTRVLTLLNKYDDDLLFKNSALDTELAKKLEKIKNIASLFLYHRKYSFFIISSGLSINRAKFILNNLGNISSDEYFFDKLLKIKQELVMNKDLLTILYKI